MYVCMSVCMSDKLLQPHWRRRSSMDCCSSYPSSTNWGHSPRVFQSESSEHRNKQEQRELGWELAVNFLILWHGFGYGFPRRTARILFPKLAWICRGFFWAHFSLSQRIHAKSTPFSETFFPVVSLGAWPGLRSCFWMPAFLCRSTKSCKLTISVLAAQPQSIDSMIWISRAKIHARFPLCLRSPNKLCLCAPVRGSSPQAAPVRALSTQWLPRPQKRFWDLGVLFLICWGCPVDLEKQHLSKTIS